MARYLERAESSARLLNANGSVILDLPKHVRPGWASLIAITGADELFHKLYDDSSAEGHVVKFMLADEDNPGSILSSIRNARENARTVRDIIPREAWEQINKLYLKARETLASGLSPKWRYEFLRTCILDVQQITGVLDGAMSHDAGYEFMEIGRNLERADMTTRIIDVRSLNLSQESDALKPFDNILWMSVLRSLTAYQMYRRHMQASVKREAVLQFLLQDTQFPRSFRFCLDEVHSCLNRLPRSAPVLEALAPLATQIEDAKPESLGQTELMQFIDELQIKLGDIHGAIGARYFGVEEEPAK
jgi:uncharacterized alpha-E superfamily protein